MALTGTVTRSKNQETGRSHLRSAGTSAMTPQYSPSPAKNIAKASGTRLRNRDRAGVRARAGMGVSSLTLMPCTLGSGTPGRLSGAG
ncbi:hypothetical protein GCM10010278_00830 [Streptomyces melanogenes]|nr:hypothetical protein GCM10010278_00830 [Streptomyces melanogenes]